jgi:hypothetical protein
MTERIFGSSPSGDVFDELTTEPSAPDPRTSAGAREVATRTMERTRAAQPYADMIDTSIREHVGKAQHASRLADDALVSSGTVRNLTDLLVANSRIQHEDEALKAEIEAFRARPDVKFFSPAAQDQVLTIWAHMGGRSEDLDKAYRAWLKKSDADLAAAAKKPSAAAARTRRGALAAASAMRGPRSEWEARHRTVRERGPMTRREALSAALTTVERGKTAR